MEGLIFGILRYHMYLEVIYILCCKVTLRRSYFNFLHPETQVQEMQKRIEELKRGFMEIKYYNLYFLLLGSLNNYNDDIRWQLQKNAPIFFQILPANSVRKCIEISWENFYADIGAKRIDLSCLSFCLLSGRSYSH